MIAAVDLGSFEPQMVGRVDGAVHAEALRARQWADLGAERDHPGRPDIVGVGIGGLGTTNDLQPIGVVGQVTEDVGDPVCLRGLGRALLAQGRAAEALQRLEQAVAAGPLSSLAHAALGDAQMANGQRAAARASWEEAARLSPYFVKPANNLGILAASEGRWDEAARHFRRVLELDPGYTRARENAGQLAVEVQRRGAWEQLERGRAAWLRTLLTKRSGAQTVE